MTEKKHILLVGDIVGYGKIASTAMMTILSRMGHSTYELPTAVVSNNFAFGKFEILDTTNYLRGCIRVWSGLGFGFDAIATGYMASPEQAHVVADYCRELAASGAAVFVDPIMGDDGCLYNGMRADSITSMRELLSVARLCYPNYTEACLLTGARYRPEGTDMASAREMIDRLRDTGSQSAVITSIRVGGVPSVVGYSHADDEYFRLTYDEIPVQFPGTGDIFAAALIGSLLDGASLKAATRRAMDTVYRLVDASRDAADPRRGIPVERFLDSI